MNATIPARAGTPPVEPTGAGDDAAIREIFLSPRVVDGRAFTEFTEALRGLVDQAAAHRAALTGVLDQSGSAVQDFQRREAQQRQNIELVTRALKSLDEREARVSALLERAGAQAEVAEKLKGLIARAEALLAETRPTFDRLNQAEIAAVTLRTEANELATRQHQAERNLEIARSRLTQQQAQAIAGVQEAIDRMQRMADPRESAAAEPLRAVIDAIRAEVRTELAGIAAALRGAAERAEIAAGPARADSHPLVAATVALSASDGAARPATIAAKRRAQCIADGAD